MSEELKDISLNFVRNTFYLKVFPYFCVAKLRKECNLLEMSVG